MKIGIILGSTRPGRAGEAVARWVLERARQHEEAGAKGIEFELVDVASYELGLLDEPTVPGAANRQYERETTRRWSAKIDELDGFVFVTAEYNHGVPAALKNAVDLLYPEWGNKAVGFVGYGADGAVRSVEHWRGIAANLYLQATRAQVPLSLFTDFGKDGFAPADLRNTQLDGLLGELVALTATMQGHRV